MARPVVVFVAILAYCIIEISCYKLIKPTYRPPSTRRPVIRWARDVEFVKTKELYNEDEGMFTDRPYLGDEETPLNKEPAHGDQSSGDQDRRPVKESDTDHEKDEEDGDHLERSVRSVNTAGAKRVVGRPGDKNPLYKWSKIVHRDYAPRQKRTVDFGTRLPKPYYNPLNPRTWRPIGIPSPIFVNRKRPYNF